MLKKLKKLFLWKGSEKGKGEWEGSREWKGKLKTMGKGILGIYENFWSVFLKKHLLSTFLKMCLVVI